jgi:hypothetical protein
VIAYGVTELERRRYLNGGGGTCTVGRDWLGLASP